MSPALVFALLLGAASPSPTTTQTSATSPSPPTPTTTKALLTPLVTDGIDVPLDVAAQIGVSRDGLDIETSSCATPSACRLEAGRRGADVLVVRLRRIGSDVVVAATLTNASTDQVTAEVTETGPSADLAPLVARMMPRLSARAATATRHKNDPDGDGVVGADDRCPTTAGPLAAGGCPDGDGDGVADSDDRCPDVKGIAADKGCAAVVTTIDPPPVKETGPEWLRIAGGASAALVGGAVGAAAGVGAGIVTIDQLAQNNILAGPIVTMSVFSAGVGVGTLLGVLVPDVACAGLCSYPLTAAWPIRLVAAVLAGGAGAGGGALFGKGLYEENQQQAFIGLGVAAAGPVVAAIVVAAGNAANGPPEESK